MPPPHAIGRYMVVADSSLRGDWCPCISHATDETGDRTLCGYDATLWTHDDVETTGPDCLRCRPVWDRLGGLTEEQASALRQRRDEP